MNIPGFSAEASLYRSRNAYNAQVIAKSKGAAIAPQLLGLGYTCTGDYCDCAGVPDCIDMINGACGGWTRCVMINGVLRCLCEPRSVSIFR